MCLMLLLPPQEAYTKPPIQLQPQNIAAAQKQQLKMDPYLV